MNPRERNNIFLSPRHILWLVILLSANFCSASGLFWIGPSGAKWDDGNNWSFEPAGKPANVSPGMHDDVFFSNDQKKLSHTIYFPAGEIHIKSLSVSSGVEINNATQTQ